MTRDERILSLTSTVERCARKAARYSTFEDVIGWAWITAIKVSDKFPNLEGDDLHRIVTTAISLREIDRRVKEAAVRTRGEKRWIKTVSTDSGGPIPSKYLTLPSFSHRVHARILAQQIQKAFLDKRGEGLHYRLRARALEITCALEAEGDSRPEVAERFGLSGPSISRIKYETLAKLAAAA